MSDLTSQDWAAIHKKVWEDDSYRSLFESDPTAAVKQYAAENGKTINKIVNVHRKFSRDKGTDELVGACC
jgi:hypothetical protein